MHVVKQIIENFGGVTATAEKLGWVQQTVNEWRLRNPPEIPPWRRSFIADKARDLGIELPSEAWEYLASSARTPKARTRAAA